MRLIWSPSALRQVERIVEYLDAFNPGAAAEVASTLIAAADGLMDFPRRGRTVRNSAFAGDRHGISLHHPRSIKPGYGTYSTHPAYRPPPYNPLINIRFWTEGRSFNAFDSDSAPVLWRGHNKQRS